MDYLVCINLHAFVLRLGRRSGRRIAAAGPAEIYRRSMNEEEEEVSSTGTKLDTRFGGLGWSYLGRSIHQPFIHMSVRVDTNTKVETKGARTL